MSIEAGSPREYDQVHYRARKVLAGTELQRARRTAGRVAETAA